VSLRKFDFAWIRIIGQNHRFIDSDVCDRARVPGIFVAENLLDQWPESLPYMAHTSNPPFRFSESEQWLLTLRQHKALDVVRAVLSSDRLSILDAPRQNADRFREKGAEKNRENAMGMMIIRHKVRDYGQWRPIFDRHADMQKRAGLINPRVYHSADSNKSEIVVVFDTEDTNKAKDFAASADLKEAMEKAGVIDTPTIYFLESID
jgi:hypothetical protein